jgi:hypothetical protein
MQVIGERCTGDEGIVLASAVSSLGYKPHCSACGLMIDVMLKKIVHEHLSSFAHCRCS